MHGAILLGVCYSRSGVQGVSLLKGCLKAQNPLAFGYVLRQIGSSRGFDVGLAVGVWGGGF